jgi:hypothetical protein
MGGRRGHGAERERKLTRGGAAENTSAAGPVDALLRLQREAGNHAVAEQVQIARQATTTAQKAHGTMTIAADELGTLTFPISSKFDKPGGSWTISAPHPGSDLELKLRKAQKEGIVLERVDVVEGESKAYMTQVSVQNLDADGDGIIFDLVYAGPI